VTTEKTISARTCDLTAPGMLASMIAGAVMLIFSIAYAVGLYLNYWSSAAGFVIIFVLGYCAHLVGMEIERRRRR
jgi:membrane protein YdbS with pleckstrin-like domain